MQNISLTKLVTNIARYRCIHKAISNLDKDNPHEDFCIPLPLSHKKLYILQSRREVGKVLTTKTDLGFVNHNYNVSHGHFQTINCFDTTDPLWSEIHNGLYNVIQATSIESIMEKHAHILHQKGKFNISQALEEFLLNVWAEYTFGSNLDIEQYKFVRLELLNYIRLTFHNNKFNRLPYMGLLGSKLMYTLFKNRIKKIDTQVLEFLQSSYDSNEGIFGKLWQHFAKKLNDSEQAQQIALDNAVLSILVYDFVFVVENDFWVKFAQDPNQDTKALLKQSMHQGFLFPFRFREIMEDNEYLRNGDYCVINLQSARLYFSFGLRQCVGMKLYMSIHNKMLEIWPQSNLPIAINEDEKIIYSSNKDLPFMVSQHYVEIKDARLKVG